MSVSESQSGRDLRHEEVLTLAEAAEYLRVPQAELADLAERNGIPARKVGGEWRFLRRGLNTWLVTGIHPHGDAWLVAQHWMMESPFAEELLFLLEERLLQKLKQSKPSDSKRGSKQAVLKYFGAFSDEDALEERLADIRTHREAGG